MTSAHEEAQHLAEVLDNPGTRTQALLRLIYPLFRLHWVRLTVGLLALISVDFLQLIIPRYVKSAVDALAEGTATQALLMEISGVICLIAIGVALLRFLWRYLIIGFSRILEKKLRNQLFDHILRMDQPFFERWTTGDLMAHASNDLSVIQMACGMGLVAAVDALVMSSAAMAFMMAISFKLTLIALIPMPLLIIGTRILSGRLHHRFNVVQERFSLLTEFARSTLVSIKLIKAYTLERFQERRFAECGEQYVRSNLKVATVQGLLFPISSLVGNAGMLLLVYYGGISVINGQISIGSFIAFVSYLNMLIWPMMAVGWVANLAQRGITSLGRIKLLLDVAPAVDNGPILPMPKGVDSLVCRNLTFFYPGATRPALRGVQLDIAPGLLGMTGKTGSGKSTLCKLLLRMYPVPDGMLFFRGMDVNQLSQSELRGCIGYVSQEPVLFADTIAHNIAFGKPDASQQEIEAAARAAAIDTDILGFPEGYQAVIGERGVKLSGGQRQRLALARALLCDRPVLIIDDALSALDVETEQQVLQGIMERIREKCVVIVSHRVNVLRLAERIILLDDGALVRQGRHQDLLDDPFYKAMVEKQQHHA